MIMDFCLVTMPYPRIELSSVALGLLKAILLREGFTVRTVYGNIRFADQIGVIPYEKISRFRPRLAVADWTFAHIAFPGFDPDHVAYVDLVMKMQEVYRRLDRARLEDLLWYVREAADVFIGRLAAAILDLKPAIVGCSSTFCQHVPSLALLRRIRELDPGVITIIGGANCETAMGCSTHAFFPWIDYVVSGEADAFIGSLTRSILDNGRDLRQEEIPLGVFAPVHRVAGYPTVEGLLVDNAPRATSLSLEDHPEPEYDDFFAELKSAQSLEGIVVPGITVESSRGCWWGQKKGCTFCGFNGKGMAFRAKSPDKFVRELDTLYTRYGVDGMETVDNILDMSYLNTVLPAIKAVGSPYRLYYEVKSNLQRRHVKELREAGVIWVQTGIESLHSEALKLMNKGCKAWHNIQFLKWCREFGVRVHWNMLYDFPGELDEWYREIAEYVPLLTHLQPPLKLVPLEFCRYSVYHENQDQYGLNLQASEAYIYVYPLSREQLKEQVYFFEDAERARIERNPILAYLTERKALKVLRKEFHLWLNEFWSYHATLGMTITPTDVTIHDTRSVAAACTHRLVGLHRDVYVAADGAPRKERLLERFRDEGAARDQMEVVIAEFVERKLAVEIDGRVIALAVREPIPNLPADVQYPGGALLVNRNTTPCAKASAYSDCQTE